MEFFWTPISQAPLFAELDAMLPVLRRAPLRGPSLQDRPPEESAQFNGDGCKSCASVLPSISDSAADAKGFKPAATCAQAAAGR
jgi:hypothetical protein